MCAFEEEEEEEERGGGEGRKAGRNDSKIRLQ